jgi:hypothetical protein
MRNLLFPYRRPLVMKMTFLFLMTSFPACDVTIEKQDVVQIVLRTFLCPAIYRFGGL